MSYMIAFRDENKKEEAMEKLYEAKTALMEACKMMEDAEEETSMNERRGRYRDGGMNMRRGRYREMGMSGEGRYDY